MVADDVTIMVEVQVVLEVKEAQAQEVAEVSVQEKKAELQEATEKKADSDQEPKVVLQKDQHDVLMILVAKDRLVVHLKLQKTEDQEEVNTFQHPFLGVKLLIF